MRKVVVILIAAVAVIALLAVFVLVPIANDLDAVGDEISDRSVRDFDDDTVADIREDIDGALDRIHSLPGRVVGIVPILSSNMDAVEDVASTLRASLDAAVDLRNEATRLEDKGILHDGRVDVDAIAALKEPLDRELAVLEDLQKIARSRRSGTNLPPVWTALDKLDTRVAELKADAEGLSALLDQLNGLLGVEEKRKYLVLLLNNAELRGGGGIVSGVGTMTVANGRLDLGDFVSVHDLQVRHTVTVPAPPNYERRYANFKANTSVWLNTAYSPNTPDDALVASRLYEKITGVETDGAIVADPRGLAALLPEDASLSVPHSSRTLSAEELPGFAYSGAYESFDEQDERRNALIGVGQAAFEVLLDEGLGGEKALATAGRAVAAGHLRFVSFNPEEERALGDVGASGELRPPEGDGMMVVGQNRGTAGGQGTKLDYWISRDVGHQCDVTDDHADCITVTTLENNTPEDLSTYAAGKPYGTLRTHLETYIPEAASLTAFEIDDSKSPFVSEDQLGWTSVGADIAVERGTSSIVEVSYSLPLQNGYALTAAPQPLARVAAVEIALHLPTDWSVQGPGRWEDEIFRYKGSLDANLSITAEPDERSGLPAFWQKLAEFWQEPLF